MSVLIVASKKDQAALNIHSKLLDLYNFVYKKEEEHCKENIILRLTDSDSIYMDKIFDSANFEAIIFISKHKSRSGYKALTVHVPGNLTADAPLGGKAKTLAISHPQRMKSALMELKFAVSELNLEYDVTLEATHHGPTGLDKPVMFIEIGSSHNEWVDEKAGEAAARAAYKAATETLLSRAAIGFGGGHYSSKFTGICIKTDLAIGHIFPKYYFDFFDAHIISKAFQRTHGQCDLAVIDWKGVKSDHRRTLINQLTDLGVNILKV